jgi:hypothetical protein
VEVETLGHTVSPSSNQPYGVARVTEVWNLARSSFYAARQREQHPRVPQQRGPKVRSDEELVAAIRQLLAQSVFTGEGEFRGRYNQHRILELGYRTPPQARRDFQLALEVAA